MKSFIPRTLLSITTIVLLGLLVPQNLKMPVVGADSNYGTITCLALMK